MFLSRSRRPGGRRFSAGKKKSAPRPHGRGADLYWTGSVSLVISLAGLLTHGSAPGRAFPSAQRTVAEYDQGPRIQRRPSSVTDSHRIPYSPSAPGRQHQAGYAVPLCHKNAKRTSAASPLFHSIHEKNLFCDPGSRTGKQGSIVSAVSGTMLVPPRHLSRNPVVPGQGSFGRRWFQAIEQVERRSLQ